MSAKRAIFFLLFIVKLVVALTSCEERLESYDKRTRAHWVPILG